MRHSSPNGLTEYSQARDRRTIPAVSGENPFACGEGYRRRRELIEPKPGDKRYARRNEKDHFTDERTTSGSRFTQDRRKHVPWAGRSCRSQDGVFEVGDCETTADRRRRYDRAGFDARGERACAALRGGRHKARQRLLGVKVDIPPSLLLADIHNLLSFRTLRERVEIRFAAREAGTLRAGAGVPLRKAGARMFGR